MSEAKLIGAIEKTFRFPGDGRLLLGPGDDCAVLRHKAGARLVITTDELVEGTHYLPRFATPEDIACKLMRVNLSDLASMGAVAPVSCVTGAGLRRTTPPDFTARFIAQLKKEALRYGLSVAGGNLAGARENHFYMTVWGEAEGKLVLRRGARPGDLLVNVGPLGEAKAGLEIQMNEFSAEKKKFPGLLEAFWRPEPQLAAGAKIGRLGLAAAMMDNSDGLLSSAGQLAAAGGCRAVIALGGEAGSAGLKSYAAARKKDWRSYVINGGEDYGLVFAARPAKLAAVKKALPGAVVVGRFEKGSGVETENYNGGKASFQHF